MRQIVRFRYAANELHAAYGASRTQATLEWGQKATIVAKTAHKSSRISANARPGLRAPKKIIDQAALSSSWAPKRAMATCALDHPPERHTSQREMPMRAYKTVHTGPNTHSGGVQKEVW